MCYDSEDNAVQAAGGHDTRLCAGETGRAVVVWPPPHTSGSVAKAVSTRTTERGLAHCQSVWPREPTVPIRPAAENGDQLILDFLLHVYLWILCLYLLYNELWCQGAQSLNQSELCRTVPYSALPPSNPNTHLGNQAGLTSGILVGGGLCTWSSSDDGRQEAKATWAQALDFHT